MNKDRNHEIKTRKNNKLKIKNQSLINVHSLPHYIM